MPDATITRGEDAIVEFRFLQSDGTTAVDLTGYTAAILDATTPLASLSTVTIPTPTNGIVQVDIAQDPSPLIPGDYSIRIQCTHASSDALATRSRTISVV